MLPDVGLCVIMAHIHYIYGVWNGWSMIYIYMESGKDAPTLYIITYKRAREENVDCIFAKRSYHIFFSGEEFVKSGDFSAKKCPKGLEVLKKSVPLHRFKKAIDCFT